MTKDALGSFHEGDRFEVRKAYNGETGRRDLVDEYTGCEAEVIRASKDGMYVWVYLKTIGEVEINSRRLKRI